MVLEFIEKAYTLIVDYMTEFGTLSRITWVVLLGYVGIYAVAVIISKATRKKVVAQGVQLSWGGDGAAVTVRERIHGISLSVVNFCRNNLVTGIAILVLGFLLAPQFTSTVVHITP